MFSSFLLVFTLASIGVPGLSNFVGELLILIGAFQKHIFVAIMAATGIVLGAVYMLRMFRKVIFGPVAIPENKQLKDLSIRETAVLSIITVLIIWIGVYPNPFLRTIETSVQKILIETQSENKIAFETMPKLSSETKLKFNMTGQMSQDIP